MMHGSTNVSKATATDTALLHARADGSQRPLGITALPSIIQGRSPVPGARIGHAGICAGGAQQWASLPRFIEKGVTDLAPEKRIHSLCPLTLQLRIDISC